MTDTSLVATHGIVAAVLRETRSYGKRSLETGGFLLATVGNDALMGVALAGDAGILRHRRLFQISEGALDRLFTFADDLGYWIPVQFHSHEIGAFMSRADSEHGLRVEGFISTIIPEFENPPDDAGSWGWWHFHDGVWHPRAPVTVQPGRAETVVVFDEGGVRDT
jgi:hypothetical protein